MTRSKPLFLKQETRYSCAAACLRMVLSAFGVHVDEADVRQLSDCSPLGTDRFQLVEAARKLGFTATRKHTLGSVDDLARLLDEGAFPIAYVDLWPLRGGLSGQYHSFVVEAIKNRQRPRTRSPGRRARDSDRGLSGCMGRDASPRDRS